MSIRRFKSVIPFILAFIVCIAILCLISQLGFPDKTLFIISIVFTGFLLFFGFVAFRNNFLGPYSIAATHLRGMAKGDYRNFLPPINIAEANDLFHSINELSQELNEQAKIIERLERMRIDFVANVSHELKTPLTSIKGYTETLRERGALQDPKLTEQFLQRIEDNTDRLTAIISDLLLLSNIESFPNNIHWSVFNTKDLTQKLESLFMPALEKKEQSLSFKFSDVQMEGDINKLEHVFANLIDNAIRYCPQGAHIEVRQFKDPLHWIVEVRDNGPGIPQEHQSRIFERFYRVDPDRGRETGGTGLGLAIVKHIVLLHDGIIDLESKPNEGTKFKIQWPRRQI